MPSDLIEARLPTHPKSGASMFQMLGGSVLIVAVMMSCCTTLATAKGYRWTCTYPKAASPDGVKNANDFKLEFIFDDATGKAVLVGNNGFSDVDVHVGSAAISFMEKLETGAVQNTIISFTGDSVHSRHSLLSGKMVPSQNYGRCAKQ
jgi:hypothetical protein